MIVVYYDKRVIIRNEVEYNSPLMAADPHPGLSTGSASRVSRYLLVPASSVSFHQAQSMGGICALNTPVGVFFERVSVSSSGQVRDSRSPAAMCYGGRRENGRMGFA